MRFALAQNWWVLAIRGLLAILFGILVFLWPGLAWLVVVYTFAAYALLDGVFALVSAFSGQDRDGPWWAVLLEGLVGIAAGIAAFVLPGLTEVFLVYLIAFWAIGTGVFQVIAAIRLRRHLTDEWALALGGMLSVLIGILLAAQPGDGVLALAWLIAAYSVVFGVLFLVLAFQLRSWGQHLTAPGR